MPLEHEIRTVSNHPSHDRPASRRARVRWLCSAAIAVPALVALTACSGAAPAAPSQPTVQAAATQVTGAAASGAATAVAAASPAAATAVAAASPVATTAAGAVGTAVGAIAGLASPSPSPSPSPAAQLPVRIVDASLADATPWLSLKNDGNAPIDVGGWRLQVGNASAALPENAVVEPGGSLTVHAGEGVSAGDELYLGNAGDALASAAMPGAPVRLSDHHGAIVAEVTVPRF
jgi:hypothetical protein